jgi:sirohydrochlorin ferrochelatase
MFVLGLCGDAPLRSADETQPVGEEHQLVAVSRHSVPASFEPLAPSGLAGARFADACLTDPLGNTFRAACLSPFQRSLGRARLLAPVFLRSALLTDLPTPSTPGLRAAVHDGCTDVVLLRSRSDGDATVKASRLPFGA